MRPGLRWRFTPACGLPPIQGLFVCFDLVTGVALALHPGLYSTSPFRACSLFAVQSPVLRWRFILACGLPPIQGLFVCYVVKELRNGAV